MNLSSEISRISKEVDEIIEGSQYPDGIIPTPLREAVTLYPKRAGKRLRPSLLIWSCGLLGGDINKAKYAATAVEVYHNWTLVHDDIIDEDETRRGEASAHKYLSEIAKNKYNNNLQDSRKFGFDFGILTGDLQQSWALNLLLKSSELGVNSDLLLYICKDLTENLTKNLISGEAIDVEFSYRNLFSVQPSEIRKMIYLKTAVLLKFCTTTGARLAINTTDENDERIKKLSEFAEAIGVAFQLQDDWLGIFGSADELGKPIASDICSSKPTILLVTALQKLSSGKCEKLKSFLGKKELREDDINSIRELIRESGGEEEIKNEINELHEKALKALAYFPDNKYKRILTDLTKYLITRRK